MQSTSPQQRGSRAPTDRADLPDASPHLGRDRLHHLGEQLESMIGPTDILSAIIRAIRESLRVPYAAVALQRLDLDALDGEAQILTVAPDERENPPNSDTLVTIPVTHLGQTVGALLVDTCDEDRCLNEDDLATLRVFAGQAGAAVHIVQLMEDLRRTRERLVLAREEERQRLRRNLHDVVGPTLTALMFRAGVLRRLIHENPPAAEAQMGEYHDQLKTVLTEVRRVVYNLRPPALDEIGMLRAIRELASQFCTEALTVEVDAPDFLPALHPAIEVAAYRIASEGMLNVARHAQATRCFVRLRVSDAAFLVEVQDNGRGISPGAAIGVGLASMRERARELGGLLDVHTTPGAGTHLIACLPMNLNSWVNLAAETKTLHLQPA